MFSFFKNNKSIQESTGFFEFKDARFQEIKEAKDMSIDECCEFLGHHPDTVYTHWYNRDLSADYNAFHFKIFTQELIFINTHKRVLEPNVPFVNNQISKLSFDELYDPYTIEFLLDQGIENHSLSSELLYKNLGLESKVSNGYLFSDKLGLYLEFRNGLIEGFQFASGLSTEAKSLQNINPKIIEGYLTEAKLYWRSDKLPIYHEINVQAKSWANLPDPVKNPYLELHRNKLGNINYFNLLIAHYNKPVTKADFLKINHGRYQVLKNKRRYKVDKFIYEFEHDNISNCYTL